MRFLVPLTSLIVIALCFQNCGSGFQSQQNLSIEQFSVSPTQDSSQDDLNPDIDNEAEIEEPNKPELESPAEPDIETEEPIKPEDEEPIKPEDEEPIKPDNEEIDKPVPKNPTPEPSNEIGDLQVPSHATYKGVSETMWNQIGKIGDPLNCREQVKDLLNTDDGMSLASCSGDCIQKALNSNKVVTLIGKNYKINSTLTVPSGRTLKGKNGVRVIIDASGVDEALKVRDSTISNIEIHNAEDIGIRLYKNTLSYRVIVANTGVGPRINASGAGFRQSSGDITGNNCLVSVEAYNGYNEDGRDCVPCANGGNADGFTVKNKTGNITFIDAHAHHNTDDGWDLWQGGTSSPNPTIRIFYSSANYNGKHPTRPNKDGNGFKLGASKPGDNGDRLVYGSAACNNKTSGYDLNSSKVRMRLSACSSENNLLNYENLSCIKQDDPESVTCK